MTVSTTSRLEADLCSAEMPGPVDLTSLVPWAIWRYGLLQWHATAASDAEWRVARITSGEPVRSKESEDPCRMLAVLVRERLAGLGWQGGGAVRTRASARVVCVCVHHQSCARVFPLSAGVG